MNALKILLIIWFAICILWAATGNKQHEKLFIGIGTINVACILAVIYC